MDITGAIANTEDIFRLYRLEHEGKMPAGFARMAVDHTIAYLERIVWLAEVRKLPGARPDWPGQPKVTER